MKLPGGGPPLVGGTAKSSCTSKWASFGLLAAVGCTVLGAKLLIISVLGSPTPLLDQWDGEADRVYAPHLKGLMTFADLFAKHNEHRIFVTHVLALMHLELAGEWNTHFEMILGAMAHVVLVVWLTALLMPLVLHRRRLLFASFVALLFSVPIGYENTLFGFQTELYCMLLFGVAALVGLCAARPFSLRWFGGLAAAALSYLSYASGIATILAACVLVGLQLATGVRKRCGRELGAVVVIALVASVMILFEATKAASGSSTPLAVIQGFLLLIAPAVAGIVPAAWLCSLIVTRRPTTTDRAWFPVALLVWTILQLALIAYGRGTVVAVRYMDIILLVYPLALVAVLALADGAAPERFARFAQPGAVIWVFIIVGCVAALGYYQSVLGAIEWSRSARQQTVNIQSYFATRNVDELIARGRGGGTKFNLAYPNPQRLAKLLGDPDIRAILPSAIRPPDADAASVCHHMWLKGSLADVTATAVHVMLSVGPAVLALGVALFFAAGTQRSVLSARREKRRSPSRVSVE